MKNNHSTLYNTKKILSLSSFQHLLKCRNAIRFILSALVLAAHAFFVGGIAFYRDLFARPISDGSTITLGIVFAAMVIVLFMVFEFVYIWITDKKLDPLQEDVRDEVSKHV